MKIVTWNCQGAFRRKASEIAAYKPDIAIIQECEFPEKLYACPNFPRPITNKWFGELESKGLCVMSYTGLEFDLHESYDSSIEYCVPLQVKGHINVNLIAVWTQNHRDKHHSYVGQAYRAINHYIGFICSADTFIIGDFNSNKIWDNERSVGNHSDVVKGLTDLGLVSLYHEFKNEKHGLESQATFYMYRKAEKPYHIDYCFIPTGWVNKVKSFEIGDYHKWSNMSDHSPMFIEFDDTLKF